ncbi:MAG: hypothetical protein V7638_3869 [Acidobacteriota bacterium]|jgi:hypothetical protein
MATQTQKNNGADDSRPLVELLSRFDSINGCDELQVFRVGDRVISVRVHEVLAQTDEPEETAVTVEFSQVSLNHVMQLLGAVKECHVSR